MRSLTAVAVLAVVALAGIRGVGAQGSEEQAVLQAQAERFRATIAQDVKSLERITAAELWYCRSSGYCEDKEHYLKQAARARVALMKPVGAMKVTVYGDTATVTGQFDQAGSLAPGAAQQHFLILEMWVKRDGRWQLAKMHATDPPNDPHRSEHPNCKEAADVFNPSDRWTGPYLGGTKTGAEKEVMQAQTARLRALVAGDAKAAANLVADELRFCDGNGNCGGKAQYVQGPSGAKLLGQWPEIMKVNVYGNTATAVGRLNHVVQIGNGKPAGESFVILETYVKRDGRWQLTGIVASDIYGWAPHRCGEHS